MEERQQKEQKEQRKVKRAEEVVLQELPEAEVSYRRACSDYIFEEYTFRCKAPEIERAIDGLLFLKENVEQKAEVKYDGKHKEG